MSDQFTPRDIEALQRIAEGYSGARAAHARGITLRSYQNYLTRLYRRLGAVDKANAVHIAWQRGLLGDRLPGGAS